MVVKILPDAPISVLVSPSKGGECKFLCTKSEVVQCVRVGVQTQNDPSQTVDVSKLAEHESEELVAAGEVVYIFVSVVLLNTCVKFVSWQ